MEPSLIPAFIERRLFPSAFLQRWFIPAFMGRSLLLFTVRTKAPKRMHNIRSAAILTVGVTDIQAQPRIDAKRLIAEVFAHHLQIMGNHEEGHIMVLMHM